MRSIDYAIEHKVETRASLHDNAYNAHIHVYNISMKKSDNIRELEYLASSQWGMFTTAQAAALGVGRTQVSRMAGAGTIEAVRRGVYRYTVGEATSHLYAKAAWLSCYPKLAVAERLRRRPHDAVFACSTAASLHGIGNFHEDPYTFIVHRRRQTSMVDLSFHLWELDESDVTYVDMLPVTTMERTVADLVRERHDPEHIMWTAQAALFKGADGQRLLEALEGLRPAYGGRIALILPPDAKTPEAREAMEENIVAEVMRRLEMREAAWDPAEQDLSPIEAAYVSIVRRRLEPILEARVAEIEARRRSDAARRQDTDPRVPDDGESKTVCLRPGTTA